MILISAQDVQKSFGTHEVLKGVSFSLQKGEKMGLVGVNGCGKTTLMRIISGETKRTAAWCTKTATCASAISDRWTTSP